MPDYFKSPVAIAATGAGMPAPVLCPGDLPLVLLPVRLETRFFTLASGITELRVRVFPDKIHLDSHEPDLTADEQTWGQHYWEQNWRAGDIAADGAASAADASSCVSGPPGNCARSGNSLPSRSSATRR